MLYADKSYLIPFSVMINSKGKSLLLQDLILSFKSRPCFGKLLFFSGMQTGH